MQATDTDETGQEVGKNELLREDYKQVWWVQGLHHWQKGEEDRACHGERVKMN